MTNIFDVISNVVLLPYYIIKTIAFFLVANLIIFIVLAAVVIAILITLMVIFRDLIFKIGLAIIVFLLSWVTLILGLVVSSGVLVIVLAPIMMVLSMAGSIWFFANNPSWTRAGISLIGMPAIGTGLLGYSIAETTLKAGERPSFVDFASHIGGELTAYNGAGSNDRYRAAIEIKPTSKYYGLAMTMSVKGNIHDTDSGKFWVTPELQDRVYLFDNAYQNLNYEVFYR